MVPTWFPTSPLKALKAKLPNTKIEFDSGADPQTAASLAKRSDLAIVFADQWQSEGMDMPNLSLPRKQDALIAGVGDLQSGLDSGNSATDN